VTRDVHLTLALVHKRILARPWVDMRTDRFRCMHGSSLAGMRGAVPDDGRDVRRRGASASRVLLAGVGAPWPAA
jgi:hypothetical protein